MRTRDCKHGGVVFGGRRVVAAGEEKTALTTQRPPEGTGHEIGIDIDSFIQRPIGIFSTPTAIPTPTPMKSPRPDPPWLP